MASGVEDVASLYDAKSQDYSQFGNGRLAAAVIDALPHGGSILDVGCASGGLLKLCEGRAGRRVGLEISPTAAAVAREHADVVHEGSAEDFTAGGETFDVVVLGDVLEHVASPERAMAHAAATCRPGGVIVASTPNIAFWKSRLRLLRGRWEYEQTGIFDTSHLRFFTRDSFARLFEDAGLRDVRVEGIVPMLRNFAPRLGSLPAIEKGYQRLGASRPGLLAFQLLGTGVRD